jgi:hypothetical protein
MAEKEKAVEGVFRGFEVWLIKNKQSFISEKRLNLPKIS